MEAVKNAGKTAVAAVDQALLPLMDVYDQKVYTPLARSHDPLVRKIPRVIKGYNVFTANNVTLARTLLVVPILASLR